MKVIVGNTGLVGSTLSEKIKFDLSFNTSNLKDFPKNVEDGSELYLTCLPATKWIVNKNTTKDFENITNIINLIKGKIYSKVILISTIDVYYDSQLKSNEDVIPTIKRLSYGDNRYLFEVLIKEFIKTNDLKIFRLPALFNKKIKKNILFDLINENNVEEINSNSTYQWYNLDNLSKDIVFFSEKYPNETVFNLFPEPIESEDIVKLFPNLINKVSFKENKIVYDFTTKYSTDGYLSTKKDTLNEIKKFINEISAK